MPRNGAGTYTLPAGNPVVTGTTISSTWANNTLSDISTALTNSIAKDGQTSPTANLPMAGYKHTGAGSANALTDYARADQVANSKLQYLTSVSGTDTITAYAPITPAAYAAGQSFRFISAGANTTTSVTLNVSGLGAIAVKKNGTTALAVGDIPAAMMVEVIFDGTNFQLYGVTKLNALTTGTSANNLVQLNSSGKLPAVDGSQLTGITTSQIQPISASVGSNALTISASSLSLDFRSTTLGSGTVTRVTGTPSNLVISSGSTLGTVNGVQSDIAVLAINNAGTIELAAVNMAGGVDLSETGLISTTAEGGAGAADSATVIYSTTARTSVAYRVIGIIRSTQATAGTWAAAPSLIQGVGGQAFAAMQSIGFGQTWQDVTGSRASGTTYYNTTGKTIAVKLSLANAVSCGFSFTVKGVQVDSYAYNSASTGNCSGTVMVPAGASYSATVAAGTISRWTELR